MTPFVVIAALSGASALIFENLWFRSASIALGSGASSSAIVLSAFMLGLAIGSVGCLRFESRLGRPMRLYASIEVVIALTGLVALVLLPHTSRWLAPAFSQLASSPAAVNALRLAVAFALLVVPAAAMGATLPVLMHAITGARESFGVRLGFVYGANTVGAVVGTLGAELLLVPAIGVLASGLAGASLNLVAAMLAQRESQREALRKTSVRPKAPVVRLPQVAIGRWPLLLVGGLSGALFLAFEVATFRFLLLFFTALHVNFAVMLAVVLCGLALGGFAWSWFRSTTRIETAIVTTTCAAAVALALSYRLFPWALAASLTLSPLGAIAAATVAFALPLSVLSGFLFAAIGHALHQTGLDDSSATGLLTAANTIGAAAGSLLAGFVLIERLGLERLLFVLASGYALLALLILVFAHRDAPLKFRRTHWTAAGALTGGLLLFPHGLMNQVFLRFPINQLTAVGEGRVAFREGRLETLQYLRSDSFGQPDYYRLVTNNHSMASTDVRSRRYMRLFAHLPSVLHPRPQSAALLGVGLGVTAKALTEDARFTSIDVVDVSSDIPDMLPVVYPDPRDNPLRDGRVRFHLEDGRFFLATTQQRFDVITAEPPPPHYAGVANLYSREFFQLVADRLNPGGIATYWLPVHDLKLEEARAIVAAFLEAFPEMSLWTGSGLDWIMMGLKPPGGGVSDEAFRAWWSIPPLSDRMREIGLDGPDSLGALFLADGARLRQWVGNVPPLTDDFARRVSVDAARDVTDSKAFVSFMTESQRPVNFVTSPLIGGLWPAGVRSTTLKEFQRQSLVDVLLSLPVLDPDDLERLLGEHPDPLLIKALFWRHYYDFDRAHSLVTSERDSQDVGFAEYRAQLALMNGHPSEAADWLNRATGPRAGELRAIRDYCLAMSASREHTDAVRGASR